MISLGKPSLFRLAALSLLLILGFRILSYHGPMTTFIRGNVGDVIAVVFIGLLLGFWTRAWWQGGVVAFVIALVMESAQLFLQTQNTARDVLLGAVFDWWDIGAYIVGALLVLIFEYALRRHPFFQPRRTT